MAGERVRGGISRGKGKNHPTLASIQNKWSVFDNPPKADTRGRGENTQTAQTALLFLHTLSPGAFTAIFVRQDFSICFQPTVVQISVLCLRRTDILGFL